jgi:uncharacterized protein
MSDPGIVLPPATNPPPPAVNTVFRGPNGIRAGWRVLIYLAIMGGLLVALGIVAFALRRANGAANGQLGGSTITPLGLSVIEGTVLFLSVIPALIMARIEHRKFGDYGLPAASHSAKTSGSAP